MIYNPDTEKSPRVKVTPLKVSANRKGPVHEFFTSIRELVEKDLKPGQKYALNDGAFLIVHTTCDTSLDKALEEDDSLAYNGYAAMKMFLEALMDHTVVFELHYPDGFKCRLQFV